MNKQIAVTIGRRGAPPRTIMVKSRHESARALKKKVAQAVQSTISGLQLNGRVTVYTNQVPLETDILRSNLYNMTGVSALAATTLGIGVNYPTQVRGFPCVPISPPGLSVLVGSLQTPDIIYSLQPLDATDYGVLPADTTPAHQQYKQGFNYGQTTLATPAPVTTGNTVIHLVQVAFQTVDANNVSRPYYNDDDPSEPIFQSNYDTRTDIAVIQLKQGIEAPSPTPPSPDPGFIGLYHVTVTYGQTSIVSGNIQKVSTVEGEPFITESLTEKVSSATIGATYVSYSQLRSSQYTYYQDVGTVNNIVINPSPAYPTLTSGMQIDFTPAHTNTSSIVTLTVNGQTHNVEINPGFPVRPGDIRQGGLYSARFGGDWILLNPSLQIISSWDGSITQVPITAGTDISITGGTISFTGGSSFVTPDDIQQLTFTQASDSGSVNNLVYNPTPAYTQIDGAWVQGYIANPITGASTLDVSSLGAKAIKVSTWAGFRDTYAGEMGVVGGAVPIYFFYGTTVGGTAVWVLMNPNPLPIGQYARVTFGATSQQTISSGTNAKIQFNTDSVPDTYSWYDSSNHWFKPTFPGVYEISAVVNSSVTTNSQSLSLIDNTSTTIFTRKGGGGQLDIPKISVTYTGTEHWYLDWANDAFANTILGYDGTTPGNITSYFEITYLGPT